MKFPKVFGRGYVVLMVLIVFVSVAVIITQTMVSVNDGNVDVRPANVQDGNTDEPLESHIDGAETGDVPQEENEAETLSGETPAPQ